MKLFFKKKNNNFDDIEEKINKAIDLIATIERQNEQLKIINKELNDLYSLVDNIIEASAGYVWCKDLAGKYIYCDKKFCCDFFGIKDTYPCPVKGLTDHFLIEQYKEKHKTNHSFGDICVATDKITLEKNKKCQFIEKGIINNEIFALDVIKTPFYIDGKIKGIIGFARRVKPEKWNDFYKYITEHTKYIVLENKEPNLVLLIEEANCFYC